MGLLDRATKLMGQKDKHKQSLLKRLQKSAAEQGEDKISPVSTAVKSAPVHEVSEKSRPRSLLQRAKALHEQAAKIQTSEKKEGLLKRAERLRKSAVMELQDEIKNTPVADEFIPPPPAAEEESSDLIDFPEPELSAEEESSDLIDFPEPELSAEEESSDLIDFPEPELSAAKPDLDLTESSGDVLSDDEIFNLPDLIADLPETEEEPGKSEVGEQEITELPEDFLDTDSPQEEITSDFDDESFSEESLQEESPLEDFDESISEIPDFTYDGNSLPELDPALDVSEGGRSDDEIVSEDPFDEWVKEAESEAEDKANALVRSDTDIVSTPSKLLFDQESGFSTEPVSSKMRDQRKIEHFLSLIEISREIAAVSDLESLLDNTLFALVGEIGAESACVFIPEDWENPDSNLRPFTYTGFEPEENWVLKKGEIIYDTVHVKDEIIYANLFRSKSLTRSEQGLMDTIPAVHIKPLFYSGKFRGVLVIGKSLSDDDYTLNELEFLKYLSDLTAAGVDRIVEHKFRLTDREDLQMRNTMNDSIFSLARTASRSRNIDEIYDLLSESLEKDYNISSYSLVLLAPGEQKYRIFAGNMISTESIERFSLSTHSDLVGMISGLTRVHELRNFRENRDILNNYTGDDIAVMKRYWIVPLVNMGWLAGFISIHNVSKEWTSFQREMIVSLSEIISPVLANHLILSEKESVFRDPFSPLEEKLRGEIFRANEFNSSVSLCMMSIRNMKRILSLNKRENVAEFFAELNKFLPGFIGESDFLSRLGQGVYVILLTGRNHEESEIFMTKLKAEIKRKNFMSDSPVEINFSVEIVTYPEDADSMEKMLEILE